MSFKNEVPDKHFNIEHKKPSLDLLCETKESGRTYETPEGNKYPSITTLLKYLSEDAIKKWQKRVGEEEAEKIRKSSANRGQTMHDIIEDYVLNKDISKYTNSQKYLFNILKENLNEIDEVHFLENALYSDKLGVAGRVDCVAKFRGKLSVIDFKTSKAPKKKEWLKSYFYQATFYAQCLYELYGIKISRIVLLMACEDGTSCVYVEKPTKYFPEMVEYLKYAKERKENE